MRRAARLTTPPIIVYSRRWLLPTEPQKTRPVASPSRAQPAPLQPRLDPEGRLHRADGVVLVGDRGEAEGGHQGRALVVDTELVDRAFVLVQRLLHFADELLGLLQCPRLMSSRPGSRRKSTLTERSSEIQALWPAASRAVTAAGT